MRSVSFFTLTLFIKIFSNDNGGNYYAEDLQELLIKNGANTSVRMFYSSNNKMTKIITYSDFVKKKFIFKHPSTYGSNSEYSKFMKDVFAFTQTERRRDVE